MEVKIRGLDPYVIKKIDEMAGKKQLSRNAYLAALLQNHAIIDEIRQTENRYDQLVQTVIQAVRQVRETEDQVLAVLNDLKGE